jgi:hypothetical protein
MKILSLSLVTLTTSTLLNAATPTGLICRDDRRMDNGPLREIILTPSEGGYLLQSQYVPTLNSPNIVIENWAEKLSCRIDAKANLAFCQNPNGQSVALIKERREVFYDSLGEEAKKKTSKYTDISVNENGVQKQSISFAAAHCETFGGEA